MYVCICNRVTEKQIHQAAQDGICNMDRLCNELKVASCCGKCRGCARKVLHDAISKCAGNGAGKDACVPVLADALAS